MQRPSLGSPADLHSPDHRRRDGPPPATCSDDGKTEKPAAVSPPEKSVHLIPFVVLLCFVVLFLVSHDPSPADLPAAGAAGAAAVVRGSGRVMSAEKAEVVAIGSHRSLHHLSKLSSRPRKLGKSNWSA